MTVATIINQLQEIETHLAELVMDEQDKCAERGEVSRGHKFVVAEEAAPELDCARTHVLEAIDELSTLYKEGSN